jgi:hypothetical protein
LIYRERERVGGMEGNIERGGGRKSKVLKLKRKSNERDKEMTKKKPKKKQSMGNAPSVKPSPQVLCNECISKKD